MTDGDSDEEFDKGQLKQTIGGQQSHESEYGEQGDQTSDTSDQEIMRKEAFGGSGAEPGMGSAAAHSIEGEGFILQEETPEEEDEASSEGGVG